ILQSRFERKGAAKDLVCVCGTQLKRKVSTWTTFAAPEADTVALRRYNEDPKKIRQKVEVIETDFGLAKLQSSIWITRNNSGTPDRTSDTARRRGIIVDMEDLELSFTEKERFHKQPDGGGGPRGYVRSINLFKALDPTGLGKVAPTS